MFSRRLTRRTDQTLNQSKSDFASTRERLGIFSLVFASAKEAPQLRLFCSTKPFEPVSRAVPGTQQRLSRPRSISKKIPEASRFEPTTVLHPVPLPRLETFALKLLFFVRFPTRPLVHQKWQPASFCPASFFLFVIFHLPTRACSKVRALRRAYRIFS